MTDRWTDEELAALFKDFQENPDSFLNVRAVMGLATELRDLRRMTAGITPDRLAAMVELAEGMGRILAWQEHVGRLDDDAQLLKGRRDASGPIFVTAGLIRRAGGGA